MTATAGHLLSQILCIFGPSGRKSLDDVLAFNKDATPVPFGQSSEDLTDTKNLVKKIQKHQSALKVNELEYMMSLVQLALNCDRYISHSCSSSINAQI